MNDFLDRLFYGINDDKYAVIPFASLIMLYAEGEFTTHAGISDRLVRHKRDPTPPHGRLAIITGDDAHVSTILTTIDNAGNQAAKRAQALKIGAACYAAEYGNITKNKAKNIMGVA